MADCTGKDMKYLLGIDQGTTRTTAVILDEQGLLVAQNSVAVPARFPRPGWVEQDPDDILRAVKDAVRPLVHNYRVAAVGFANQGETFIVWDAESGTPLTPAIVWQDKRGADICAALAGQVDKDSLRKKTGLLLDSYFSAPKLRYLWEHDAQLRHAIDQGRARFGTTETWVLWNLSKRTFHFTDPSTASRTLLFEVNRLDWDDELLSLFGATRTLLPRIVPSAGYAGDVDFGNGEALAVHALLVDQQAALFGQACFTPGAMKCSFGTGSFLLMNIGAEMKLSTHGLLTTLAWHWNNATCFALDGGIFVTGAAVQWLSDSLGFVPTPSASADAALQSTDHEVVFVPALQGLAAPHWLAAARGAMFGLSRATRPADIVRATLDGIAMRVYEVVAAMAQDVGYMPSQLKVDGGPSANPYLMQYIADVLNLEVHVASGREATAIGIANLAAHSALGVSLEELASRWQSEAIYRPQIDERERERRLSKWNRALDAVKDYHR